MQILTMDDKTKFWQILIYGFVLFVMVLGFLLLGMKKPSGVLDQKLPGNSDLLYFATDAPDTFIIYSPGLHDNRLIFPASERMADMVISSDGKWVWTATKSGFIDRYNIPVEQNMLATASSLHVRIAPVLSAVAVSANGRFLAVGYGNSEDYNSRNIKILPADKQTISLSDELAEFTVSGDIQDIVANPVEDIFYIINSHSDRVRIYNADRFRLEPEVIELGNSPGKFVVSNDGLRGYGAMNARKAVAVVDLETNELIEYIMLGFPPHAMAFNPDGSRLYVASRDSSTIAVLNTETNEIVTTFDLPPRMKGLIEFNFAEMIALSSDEKYLYVMPKRPELLVYDISMTMDPSRSEEKPIMVQSEVLAATPFFMEVVRGYDIPGV